jgi:hypothetical protein
MKEKCNNCGRHRCITNSKKGNKCNAAYSYVVHDYYGCDSGCCGHNVILCDKDDNELDREWMFSHPYGEDHSVYAKNLCKKYWPNVEVRLDLCEISND